jgi:hypothetical protein
MKTTTVLMTILGATLFSLAHADMQLKNTVLPTIRGGLVGNGGGTVVCRKSNQSIKSVEVLDFYEARTIRNVNLDIQTLPGDWRAKAKAIVARVEAKSELRFQLYSSWLASFESEDKILTDVQFSTVPDAGYIGVPEGCEFEQAAIQRQPMFSGDARYYINAELWNAMDDTQKAGLVLHEIIYREAIGYGQTDSIRSRYMTGLYSSKDFASQTEKNYWQVLEQAHYELTDVIVPDQLKGQVVTQFDPNRLWQAGPDTGILAAIALTDRYVVKIGKCSNGCDTYVPSQFWLYYGYLSSVGQGGVASALIFSLGQDIQSMTIAGNQLIPGFGVTTVDPGGNSILAPPPRTLANASVTITQNLDQTVTVSLGALPENTFNVTEVAGAHRALIEGIYFAIVKGKDNTWSWQNAEGEIIVSGTNKVASNLETLDLLAKVSDPCVFVKASYVNNLLDNVSSIFSDESICRSAPQNIYGQAANMFVNGAAFVNLDPRENDHIDYQSAPENSFANSNQNYSEWSSLGRTSNREWINCNGTGATNECLQPAFDSNRVMTKLTVLQSATVTFGRTIVSANGEESSSSSESIAKIGTDIILFPSGNINSFVNAVDFKMQQGTQSIDVPSGVTVLLDDNGNLVSFH